MSTSTLPAPARSLVAVVGFLACVELASGILQGYYTPIFTDLARHLSIKDADVNWFEAAQLVVSALVVPPLARLGDLIGHRRVLLLATLVTAIGSWVMALAPNFGTFLVGAALQGAYVVWLPLEVAIIHRRTSGTSRRDVLTRRASAALVATLELAVIIGALASGALVESLSMTTVLAIPAVVVTLCLVAIWVGVESAPGSSEGTFDWPGLAVLTLAVGLVMGGLIAMRLSGPSAVLPWVLIVLGVLVLVPFGRIELGRTHPLVDVRLLGTASQWPLQVTAFLFGISILGAQIPLSTYLRSDPDVAGYGFGLSAGSTSIRIGLYVISLLAGALLYPPVARRFGVRPALILATLLVALGYAGWLPFHDSRLLTIVVMMVAGAGSGALVAALPSAAAAVSPADRVGFATGMTNGFKTLGGAVASAVFAICLASTGTLGDPTYGHAPLSGYLAVWSICSATALVAALALLLNRTSSGTARTDREALAG
ncbi:MFS transporter [Nocardioides sp. Kera G14]|uniref:MFS transporter n=1 Tax=Nocardioides sp. Kera G14 TaxID=2884264 RepID=UPI001D111D93|nr:MFS transporter [Nocardioides sp. Kera G14]UDY23575.1 MFS transporter [Nocardioides sp. Kera G14]